MVGYLKQCKEAATLILIAKVPYLSAKPSFNYKLLTIKRSAKSSFMPETIAFPGGGLDKADTVTDWINLYEKFGYPKSTFDVFKERKFHAPIFQNDAGDSRIPKYLSLRIAAIRETFEECGILLCKSRNFRQDNLSTWASYISNTDILEWQKRVHRDASQMLELCYKYELVPDVWALNEWSNWVTPSVMKKRFETIFFFSAVPNIPSAVGDDKEIEQLEWDTPSNYLSREQNDEIMLPPPQYYEILRLLNFNSIEEASEFARSRSSEGCERFLPYRIFAENDQITLLPGDDLYPGDSQAEVPSTETIESIPESKIMHRILHRSNFKNELIMSNYLPKYRHVLPVLKSKL